MQQLDLFEDVDELKALKLEIKNLHKEFGKLKKTYKTQFQKVTQMFLEVKEENEQLRLQLETLNKKNNTEISDKNSDLVEKLFAEAYEM